MVVEAGGGGQGLPVAIGTGRRRSGNDRFRDERNPRSRIDGEGGFGGEEGGSLSSGGGGGSGGNSPRSVDSGSGGAMVGGSGSASLEGMCACRWADIRAYERYDYCLRESAWR